MAIKTRIALGLSIVFLIAGSIIWWGPVHGKVHPSFNVVLPLGAIFMGLFLISNLFDKEDKKYGEDQKRAAAKVGEPVHIPPADRL